MTPPRSGISLSPEAAAFYPSSTLASGATDEEGWHMQGQWMLPRGWNAAGDYGGVFTRVFELADVVAREGACALPGVNIKYDNFMACMWRAVYKGFVTQQHAEFVSKGLSGIGS